MKFSLARAHASIDVGQTHLWSLKFLNDDSLNLIDMGGSVGKCVPCISIREPISNIQYGAISLPGGISIPYPAGITYLGDLVVEVYETSRHDFLTKLLEWSSQIMPEQTVSIENLQRRAKPVMVSRYTRNSGSSIYENSYAILPPPRLDGRGDDSPNAYIHTFEFPIVKVAQRQGITR